MVAICFSLMAFSPIVWQVLRKAGNKGFWKIFKSVAVEEVTFGLAPPQFQFCTAKYDPSRSYLLLIMDVHYHSSGMQVRPCNAPGRRHMSELS